MKNTFDDIMGMMAGDFGETPVEEKKDPAQQDEQSDVMDMLVGDFNPNHDPANGQFTENGGSSGGGGSKGSSQKQSPKCKAAIKRAVEKDLYLSDLEYKNSDRYDFFDNDRGSMSVGAIENALETAYNEGVKKAASNVKSISAAQIEKAVSKGAEKWIGMSLEMRNSDDYDYFQNERGHFDVWDLHKALEHAYGAGFSSGDHYSK